MPRPKLAERRDCQLNFSLTRTELSTLRTRAEAADMHLVDYGRAQLLRQPKFVQPAVENGLRADRLVVVQLKRLGNLLNQLVRLCHARGEPMPPMLAQVLADIRAILDRMLRHGA